MYNELLSYSSRDFVRKEELGTEFCLEGMNELAKPVFALFSRIDESKLDYLEGPSYVTLKDSIGAFRNFFDEAQRYNAKDGPRGSGKHSLHGRLDHLVSEHYAKTQVMIDYLFPLDAAANDFLESIKSIKEDHERLLKTLQNVVAREGVGENATYFVKAAESHRQAASKWLWIILCLGISLVAFALSAPLISQVPWFANVDLIHLGITKFIIFTAIASGMVVAIRNYSTHRHNDIVNSHREMALLTFERLAQATSDEQARRVILTHASACIFSPQPTGLVKEGGALKLPLATELLRKATD